MIVPSIDIRGGSTVQLRGGKDFLLDAGDPLAVAERFAVAGEIAVVDLDAALGTGDNRAVIEELVRRYPCRVGGGIRDEAAARRWLDLGATRIVLGTAAEPALLRRLPRERVVVALDAVRDEVTVEGWTRPTGRTVFERLAELRDLAGGFLVTFIENEGRLTGVDPDRVGRLREAAGNADLTVAGGVRSPEDVAVLDRLGADAQVGLALYNGDLDLGDAVAAALGDPEANGLWPTVVADERGVVLGLAWSDRATVAEAVRTRRGIYRSRSRGRWEKGLTSGAVQELVRVDLDCDRDALRFTVRQADPGFCHRDTRTCWGEDGGLGRLARRLRARRTDAPEGSYTARLFADPDLLAAKIREEAEELARARGPGETVHEAADVLYFTLAALAARDVDLAAVERELDRRELRETRRPGDAKPLEGIR